MRKKPLEVSCYVAGAGAFGVFFRWLQDQLAFDEAGLNERSVFNLLVPILIFASIWLFNRFLQNMKEQKLSLPEEYCDALFNPGKLFTAARWASGAVMAIGAVLLLISSETDQHADLIRILCLLAFLSGVAYPLVLGAANYEFLAHEGLVRVGMLLPVLMYAFWLVLCYLQNAYNSVAWSYAIEIFTIIAAMMGYFRAAGFAFHAVKELHPLFAVMVGCMMCIMVLADERYMGMQLIFLASAAQLLLYEWVMVRNLEQGRPRTHREGDADVDDGGFEIIR